MNPTTNPLQQIAELISKKNSGVIVLPQNPTADGLAAATALYLGLSKLGKNLTIVCSTPVKSDLAAADKIQTNFATGGDNLVISFPYTQGAVDKVEYGGNEGNFFNIIVVPHAGAAKLDPQKVQYSYTGGKVDFIVTIDAPNLRSLGQIYTENQQEFGGKTIINIDRHLVNDMYGTVNYVQKTSSSTSELVLRMLQALQIEIDREIATNLYTGLSTATNNFTSYSVNAGTFETAANLLKFGATKRPIRPTVGQPQSAFPGMPGNMSRPSMRSPMPGMPQMGPAFDDDLDDDFEDDMDMAMPPRMNPAPQMSRMTPQQPMPAPMPQPQAPRAPQVRPSPQPFIHPAQPANEKQQTPIEDVEDEKTGQENPQQQATPQDWLKPKIYRGGGLI